MAKAAKKTVTTTVSDEIKVTRDKTILGVGQEVWFVKYWRPAIAWQYFAVCMCDFIIFPSMTFAIAKWTGVYTPWEPLTLKESGFYHLAMAAIVGVTAWSRGQEKIKKIDTLGSEVLDQSTVETTTT